MSITVIKGGLLTTMQDMGRTGYQRYGVPVSGVMDIRAAATANILVGNVEDEAVLEATLIGPSLKFDDDVVIAVTGGNLSPAVNSKAIPMYQAVPVGRGSELSFNGVMSGCRAYVAFAGGMDIKPVMGSKSTYIKGHIGGYEGRKLEKGDVIDLLSPHVHLPAVERRAVQPDTYDKSPIVLRVIRGPQDDCFTLEGIKTFFGSVYTLTAEFDRMGCRLEGNVIEHVQNGDIISDGIAFGAVQVPTHGNPIIMMADRQTTGGYTKIANVISVDLPLIAQAKAGDKIEFREVTMTEAQKLYIEERNRMAALRQYVESQSVANHGLRRYSIKIDGKPYEVTVEREE